MIDPNRAAMCAAATIMIALAAPVRANNQSEQSGNVTVGHDAKQVCTNGSKCILYMIPPPPKCEKSLKYLPATELQNCVKIFDKQLRFFEENFQAEQEKAAFKTQDRITEAGPKSAKADDIWTREMTARDNARVDHDHIFQTTYRPEALRYISAMDRRLGLEPPSSKGNDWDEIYAARALFENGWDYSRLADYLDRVADELPV